MYVTEIELTNVRLLRQVRWAIASDQAPGWHVIVGDNGSGKSSFLRSIALAFLGGDGWLALRQDPDDWIVGGSREGASIELALVSRSESGDATDKTFKVRFRIPAKDSNVVFSAQRPRDLVWFSAGYGPFRRFTGSDPEFARELASLPHVARHTSLFDERAALTESLAWLKDLKFKSLEGHAMGVLLEPLTAFINGGDLLPHGLALHEIASTGITFVDGNGCRVPIESLSDGYRSILSLTLDLLRQLSLAFGAEMVFDVQDRTKVACSGVVLIDEVDVHLHPTWQRSIGLFFRKHFPRMQFIVTSHSPLVCQAAEHGTVFRLPRPGDDEPARMIEGLELDRILYGSVLDAYDTGIFGQDVTRSDQSTAYLRRLAELNQKEIAGDLSQQEREEQRWLRTILPGNAYDSTSHP